MPAEIASTDQEPARAVWALLGRRVGDNLQARALAEAVADACGLRLETRQLEWRRSIGWTPLYGRMGPSLQPLTDAARSRIAPPWPELVISVGWRSAPVARWIGRQGGARLVHIGRPRAPLAAFDLVLTTPQYGLPAAPNVVELAMPIAGLDAGVGQAAAAWQPRLAHLPRPWIAVLVGGDAPPLRLTVDAARNLGAEAAALTRARGGSLLIATGPRTGADAAAALMGAVDVPHHAYLWGEEGENPYRAYLALADAFVVTADSISMAAEAARTGRPVHLFDLPEAGHLPLRALRWLDRRLGATTVYQGLIRDGWIYAPRNPGAFHAALIGSGRAVRLGDAPPPEAAPKGAPNSTDSTARAVDAVREMLARPRA